MSTDGDAGDTSGQLNVAVTWPAVTMPPVVANQFAASLASSDPTTGELVLTVGWAGMPLLSGSADEQMEQALAIESLEAVPVGRFSLNRRAATELLGILQQAVGKWNELDAKEVPGDGDR